LIFVTGDIHGSRDIQKLSASNFPMQPQLSREDFVIICGDFGLVWQDCAEERRWLNWLEEKPWTTLWVDGNHENFDRLHTYPATEWHGGKIQKIMPHVFHLCRGQIFSWKTAASSPWAVQKAVTKNTAGQACRGGRKNSPPKRSCSMPERHWSM